MRRFSRDWVKLAVVTSLWMLVAWPAIAAAAGTAESPTIDFPPSLDAYGDAGLSSLGAILQNRIEKVPFNLWATLLFVGAIVHTVGTHRFRHISLPRRTGSGLHALDRSACS